MGSPYTPSRIEKVTLKRWDIWTAKVIEVTGWRCRECAATWTANDGMRHFAGCLVREMGDAS